MIRIDSSFASSSLGHNYSSNMHIHICISLFLFIYLNILSIYPSAIKPQIRHFHQNRHSLRPQPFCHLICIFAKPMANFPPDSLILSHSPFSPKLSLCKGSLLISHLNSQMYAKFAIFVTFSFFVKFDIFVKCASIQGAALNISLEFSPFLPFSPLNAFLDISV